MQYDRLRLTVHLQHQLSDVTEIERPQAWNLDTSSTNVIFY